MGAERVINTDQEPLDTETGVFDVTVTLLSTFLSPLTNRCTDGYGGPLVPSSASCATSPHRFGNPRGQRYG